MMTDWFPSDYSSSMMCSFCGYRYNRIAFEFSDTELKERLSCASCGHVVDRTIHIERGVQTEKIVRHGEKLGDF